ncbi:long-chain fatty acid--CoA ligase [Janthinobacterium sp. 17J80-10]|uniref:acyl-CoA synthetase n=1 Tax=Janthinobacterium sp. 17J80-10 TaxID=2497863 RepID=UPI0010059867|nr:long-chain fatty acid--CoA ligase [Janthinobacterium sp. 17J80-10]QAU33406.1 long-chain-fatty-acid--CoA ligase [Janthinobacterium sp. 17J80-10]
MNHENASGRASALGLAEWLRRRVVRAPQRPALTCDNVTWTYGELWQRVEQLSAVLAAHGVGRGDRVGHLDFDGPMFFVSQFAVARLGAVFVPLNFRLSAPELAFIINDAGLQLLLAGPSHQGMIDSVRANLACRHYLGLQADAPGWPAVVPRMGQVAAVPPQVAVDPEEVAALMYTSGTTGHPKGAMLTHQNIWSQCLNVVLSKDMVSTDVALGFVPLFHVGGMLAVTLPTLVAGGHVVLQRGFDAGAVLQAIRHYRVTIAFAVPAMLLFMSQHADFAGAELASLRLLSVGGGPMPVPLLQIYEERGIPVQQGYGLTETSATVTFLAAERAADKPGSCGTPGMMTEICLQDFSGQVIAAAGVKGEVCVRSSNVMKGYWNNADASAAAFDQQGWFHTGDVGYCDDEGFLYLSDRLKDVVITGGENVYPAEVESVLYAHPAIAECAVVGAPDDKWGERVVAIAVLKPGAALTLEELRRFAEGSLARYKLPRELHLVTVLPRNAAGKLLKSRLREQIKA